jgi:hypothetical protein
MKWPFADNDEFVSISRYKSLIKRFDFSKVLCSRKAVNFIQFPYSWIRIRIPSTDTDPWDLNHADPCRSGPTTSFISHFLVIILFVLQLITILLPNSGFFFTQIKFTSCIPVWHLIGYVVTYGTTVKAVLRIRIHRIHMFLGLLDSDQRYGSWSGSFYHQAK